MQPDNLNQQSMPPVDPSNVLPPTLPPNPVAPMPVNPEPQNSVNYAGISTRFFAVLVDGVVLGLFSFVLGTIGTLLTAGLSGGVNTGSGLGIVKNVIEVVVYIFQIVYPIYFIGAKGQTPGKMVMKIKVIKADTGEVPGYLAAFLREFIGKMISGLVLGLGYITAFKDPKKQSWHDKIAGTIVVKI